MGLTGLGRWLCRSVPVRPSNRREGEPPRLTDVHVKARVIKRGRLMCHVAVDVLDTGGQLVAVAQVDYVLLDKMPAR